ncbi:hypothetical protein LTR17_016636 [Elasticomyces elasticus]|nr:hypothetical protein LTR17_016636 [Elasticomyces elasticus]
MATKPGSVAVLQTLDMDFTVPGRDLARVTVSVRPNDNPRKIGQHLLFPDKPLEVFIGYPICQAEVSSPESIGYAAYYGWIQMVAEDSAGFEMDLLPMTADLNTPVCFFGAEPQLFDCPSRWKDVTNLDWTAVSFLTYVEDTTLSRDVRPILAFQWGFRIVDGDVRVKNLRPCNVDRAWEQQRGLLESKFVGWQFGRLDGRVNLRNYSDSDA